MRIGIDLGGTKIEGIALSDQGDDQGQEIFRQRIATPREDYTATVNSVVDLVKQIEQQTQQQGSVGIGIPGAVSPATGLIKNANSTWLIGQPFKNDIESALGRAIRMANDANCFTISEATDGTAKDASVVFGVIIGTGTGGGICINKQIVTGNNAIAGEWGHNPLPWPQDDELPGRACYCGKRGCIETFLSGPGFTLDHKAHGGEEANPQTILAQAENGDERAEASLKRYEDRLARALASIINVIDPDVIVLGGGMSNITRLYKNVPRLWGKYVFSDNTNTELRPPKYGDSSGVRGAAWLWNKQDS